MSCLQPWGNQSKISAKLFFFFNLTVPHSVFVVFILTTSTSSVPKSQNNTGTMSPVCTLYKPIEL